MDCNATAINPFNRALVHPNIAISIQMHKFKWEWEFNVENRNKNQHRYTFYIQIFCCCCCSTFPLCLSLDTCTYVCMYGANRWNTQFFDAICTKTNCSVPHRHHFNFQFQMAFKFELQSIVSFENSSHLPILYTVK